MLQWMGEDQNRIDTGKEAKKAVATMLSVLVEHDERDTYTVTEIAWSVCSSFWFDNTDIERIILRLAHMP